MDANHFDALAKSVVSRRSGLALSMVGLLGITSGMEAKKRRKKKRRKKSSVADPGTTAPPAGCTPNCNGKVCGPDGCGDACGTCGDGESCDSSGRCACVPQCTGKTCGPDGCGSDCGTCRNVETCQAGNCTCGAPGPGETCTSATQCCAYTELAERACSRGDGACSSFLSVCRYGLSGPCGNSCDCMGDLICERGSCACPDGRDYLGSGLCCGVGLTRCGDRCCSPGTCSCFPWGECRCSNLP